MNIDPGLLPLAFLFLALAALLTVPLAAAVFFAGTLLVLLNPDPLPPGFLLTYSLAVRLNSPALISIPLFALAGEMAVAAGITDRLLDTADALCGRGSGSVGARTILGCTLFACVSGVGPAAVTAEGKRLVPALTAAGYSPPAAAGAIACAAGLSIIIPASVPLTVYAAASGIQTNIVFAASFLPGLLVAAALLAAMAVYSRMRSRDSRAGPPASEPAGASSFRRGIWSLLMPVLVLTALFTGFLTAPEAAAFASAYAAGVGVLAHRCLTRDKLRTVFDRAARTAAPVLLMAGIGSLFAILMDACGFSAGLADELSRLSGGGAGTILLLNGILLLAGCILDIPVIISFLVPLLLPLSERCGLSTAHFGVIVVLNLAVGLVTPPQASNLAAAAREAGAGLHPSAKAAFPFIAVMLFCLGAVSFVPELSLFLPRLLGWPV